MSVFNNDKFKTYRLEDSAGRFPFMSRSTSTCNIPFSVSEGFMMEGRRFSLRCINPTVQVFMNGRGFARRTKKRCKEKQLKRVSGTNQNICFVTFTFTDCLVEFSKVKTQLQIE